MYLLELYHITLLSSSLSILISSHEKGLQSARKNRIGWRLFQIKWLPSLVGEFFILNPSQLSNVCKSLNRIS